MSSYILPVLGDFRVSSGYGRRTAPTAGASSFHKGIDLAAPRGTPVVAPTNLLIKSAGPAGGYGNYITGVDASGQTFGFGHLSDINVRAGQTVSAGTRIGSVGSTGTSTGNHLHYSVKDTAGNWLDPSSFLSGDGIAGQAGQLMGDGVTAAKDAALMGLDKALEAFPGLGQIWTGAKALGVPNVFQEAMGECGWNPICHLQKWFEETGFIQRIGLFILGAMLILGGLYLFKPAQELINRTVKSGG